jgi:CRISPR/Cas system CSM-associated protein Csm5 (group 7 of RAMP superfamily)
MVRLSSKASDDALKELARLCKEQKAKRKKKELRIGFGSGCKITEKKVVIK